MSLLAPALILLQIAAPPATKVVLVPTPAGLFSPGETRTVELPPLDPGLNWTEMVPSWNVEHGRNALLTLEARVLYSGRETRWYSFGTWTLDPAMGRRGSVAKQKDEDGAVLTDTLRVARPGGCVQLRLTARAWPLGPAPRLRRLVLSFLDGSAPAREDRSDRGAWGKVLEPPRKAQGDYPNGKVLCSPTCVSMVLGYWAERERRPDWAAGVSTLSFECWDPVYNGAGNWSYNVAAAARQGLVAYCARLAGLSDLEKWTAAGVPVVCSVSWYLLHGRPIQPDENGHLVVLVGFDASGNPVFNDPGDRKQVRKTYKRSDFEQAWRHSRRTVYLIYPEGFPIPAPEGEAWLRE